MESLLNYFRTHCPQLWTIVNKYLGREINQLIKLDEQIIVC